MSRIALMLAFLLAANVCQAADTFALEPDFRLDDQSGVEWSAAWWQWAMSATENVNPVADRTGANCTVNQGGRVWFLAGGFGTTKATRSCTVPAGRYLFFPMVNRAYWPRPEDESQFSCQQAKARAVLNKASTLEPFVAIDGVAVEDAVRYRYRTEECFNIFARTPPVLDPYDAFPSASDGFWIMLKPLPPGKHVLTYGARYNASSPAFGKIVQDVQYEIEVK